jgi:hypothetical protein
MSNGNQEQALSLTGDGDKMKTLLRKIVVIVRGTINGHHNVQTSCPDKLLTKGYPFVIQTTINELQPSRVSVLEILFRIEIEKGLPVEDHGQSHPSTTGGK